MMKRGHNEEYTFSPFFAIVDEIPHIIPIGSTPMDFCHTSMIPDWDLHSLVANTRLLSYLDGTADLQQLESAADQPHFASLSRKRMSNATETMFGRPGPSILSNMIRMHVTRNVNNLRLLSPFD